MKIGLDRIGQLDAATSKEAPLSLALVNDIGEVSELRHDVVLGDGAHLAAVSRTRVGSCRRVGDAQPLRFASWYSSV